MTNQALTPKHSMWIHAFFAAIGVLVVVWGFVGIGDSLSRPLATGASWQAGAAIVLVGGMILGAALNNLFKVFRSQRKINA